MAKKTSGRLLVLIIILALTFSMVLAGCGKTENEGVKEDIPKTDDKPAADEPAEEEPADKDDSEDVESTELTFEGKISFFAQAYTPVEPTDTNPNPPTAFQELADQYTKLHPGITIEFVPSPQGQDYKAWFTTKAAGGDLPEIFWHQATDINQLPADMVTDFTPFLEKPNPYVEGNEKWVDLFRKTILDFVAAPDDTMRLIIGDYVDTMVMYNKDLFAKAGISDVPTTWTELMDVCQKLQDADITPYGIDASMKDDNQFSMYSSWMGRVLLSNMYADDFDEFVIDDSNGQSALSKVVAYKKGLIGPNDPRWMKEWWPLMKDFSKYWQKGAFGGGDLPRLFGAEQIAMYQTGSWDIKTIKDLEVKFEYGSFPFPNIDKGVSEYATDAKTSNAAGGPLAAFSYGASTSKSNSSMTDEKLAATIDWLMFITTPENNADVCNDHGVFVPTVIGAEPIPELAWIADQMDEPLQVVDGGIHITNDFYVTHGRLFQMYLNDQISLEDGIERLAGEFDKAIETVIEENPDWDVEKYLK